MINALFVKCLTLSLLIVGKYQNLGLNELHRKLRQDFGDIVVFPSMMGKPEFVFAYDPEGMKKIYQYEDSFPSRTGFFTLKYARKIIRPDIYCGTNYGSLGYDNGERWYNTRSVANPILLQSKSTNRYIEVINQISKDFIKFIENRLNDKNEVEMTKIVNRWTMEGVAALTLDRRLGLLNENIKDKRAEKLFTARLKKLY